MKIVKHIIMMMKIMGTLMVGLDTLVGVVKNATISLVFDM
jgi:hypothetical protein